MDHQHLLHFTPFHLGRLLASLGFEVIEVDTAGASRFFGMSLLARLTDPTRDKATGRLPGVTEERRRALVESGHGLYRTACRVRESKERQAGEVAACVARHVEAAGGAAHVYFWPANEYARRIAEKLGSALPITIDVVDISTEKIGTRVEGFPHEVLAPAFPKRAPHLRIFVLCSPAWNPQINAQLRVMALENVCTIDGIPAICSLLAGKA